jgi:hypothetical protein
VRYGTQHRQAFADAQAIKQEDNHA